MNENEMIIKNVYVPKKYNFNIEKRTLIGLFLIKADQKEARIYEI